MKLPQANKSLSSLEKITDRAILLLFYFIWICFFVILFPTALILLIIILPPTLAIALGALVAIPVYGRLLTAFFVKRKLINKSSLRQNFIINLIILVIITGLLIIAHAVSLVSENSH